MCYLSVFVGQESRHVAAGFPSSRPHRLQDVAQDSSHLEAKLDTQPHSHSCDGCWHPFPCSCRVQGLLLLQNQQGERDTKMSLLASQKHPESNLTMDRLCQTLLVRSTSCPHTQEEGLTQKQQLQEAGVVGTTTESIHHRIQSDADALKQLCFHNFLEHR